MATTSAPVLSTPELLTTYFSTDPSLPSLTTCTVLSGGFANFTFRATTSRGDPLIIKHAAPYVAQIPSFTISPTRTYYEHAAMSSIPRFTRGVLLPKALHFTRSPALLAMSDAGAHTFPLSAALRVTTQRDIAHGDIGRRLGAWLAGLHSWGRSDAAAGLREILGRHKDAEKTWVEVTYGRLLSSGGPFPGVVEGARGVIAEIVERVGRSRGDTICHGDFWSGNVVVDPSTGALTVLDFEMSKVWEEWGDIGQMCAELYEPYWFEDNKGGLEVLKGFLEAYREAVGGRVERETVKMAVVHLGVHLICWPALSGWGKEGEAEECAKHGLEFVQRGWSEDWVWIRTGVMAPLVDDSW